MKLISGQEYNDLMAFMKPRLKVLWEDENNERKKRGEEPLAAFQFGFSQYEIFTYISHDPMFYLIFNDMFLSLINTHITLAMNKFPKKFGTGDARDVIDAMYDINNFAQQEEKDRYVECLSQTPCCYVVYKKDGVFLDDILRIEFLRKIMVNKDDPTKFDFVGGLLHLLKHFSIDGNNLATGGDINDVFDIHHIVYLLACAFIEKTEKGKKYVSIIELQKGRKLFCVYYKDETTGFYYLDTCFKRSH